MKRASIIKLILPNGDLVLQRRDHNTPISPGLLGLFGGHIEAGELPKAAAIRELKEETSLNVSSLDITFIASVELPSSTDPNKKVQLHFYQTHIQTDDFLVYEGKRSETHSLAALKDRTDLAPSARYLVDYLTD